MRRAGQPSSAAPAPPHQANDVPQPAKQKIPNNPNLSEPILNQQFVGPGFPKTRSANLGFEIRGFSCPPPPPLPQRTPLSQIRQTGIPNEPNFRRQRQRNRHPSSATASPQKTHSAKFAKPVYQTNPISTPSDNAIALATGRPPPPVTQESQSSPKRRNRTTKRDREIGGDRGQLPNSGTLGETGTASVSLEVAA